MKPRFHKSRLASFTLALTAGLLVTASTAQALTYYWDNNGTTGGFGTAGGTWTAPTVSQWSTDSTGVATPEASITTLTTDALNFGTATDGLATGTVTVSGTVDANTLTFDSASGAVELSGGIITLGGTTPTITVNNAADTISSEITGTAGLTKSGTGTLTLSGSNTYSGATVILNGKIIFTTSSAFGTSSLSVRNTSSLEFGANGLDLGNNVQIQNSAGNKTMQLDLAGTNTGTLSGQLDIRLTSGNGDFFINTGADDTLTLSGTVYTGAGGGAGLTKTGAGALMIQVGSAYTGETTINGGKLQINNASGSVNWTPGLININNGSTLEFTGAGQTILDGAGDNITFGSGGGGSIVMTKNTIWRNASIITTGGAKNTVSGTFFNGQAAGGTNRVIYGVAVGTDPGGIDLEVSSEHRSLGGITKDGNGTLALTNTTNNMGAGATIIINAGTVEIGGAGRLQSGSYAGAITNDGTFNYNSSAAQTLSGVISGTGALTQSGAGTLTLTGANDYSGATTVSAGILAVDGDAIPNSGTLIINGTGKVQATGTEQVAALTLGGVVQTTPGTYGATDSGATTINDTYFTGTAGVVNLGAPAGFADWITGTFANGTVTNQGANDDDDNDGISNLVEYAIDGQDPTVPNASVGTFAANTLSFTKRAGTSGLTYAIEESTGLVGWTEVSGGSYVNNATTISYPLTPGSPEKNFVRLKVTQN